MVVRLNTRVAHSKSRLNKKRTFLGISVLFMLAPPLVIPDVLAAGSCSSTSPDWTDLSLCGHGAMIAVVVTDHDTGLESKLAAYDTAHGLPACTVQNGCLEIATPFGTSSQNPSSGPDMSFFITQAHQFLPGVKILVVEAKSISWQDKHDAANYAMMLPEVAKVSSISYSKVVMIIGLILK